jgi:hypothetical protein
MPKIDYKKDYKDLYLPGATPSLLNVPAMPFLMVDGKGDPQGSEYQNAVSVLYSLSYTIKMKGKDFAGYYDYTVFPLEGLWWCEGGSFDFRKRDVWRWTSLLRQPDFVTPEVFAWAVEAGRKKKPELDFSHVRLESCREGLCVQIMHPGPYADEPASIAKMTAYLKQNGYVDEMGSARKHHEIYLSDPGRVPPEKLKTVIRHPVTKLA